MEKITFFIVSVTFDILNKFIRFRRALVKIIEEF